MAELKKSPFEEDIETVYRTRRGWLRAIASRAGAEDNADLVQDAFVKALEHNRTKELKSPLAFLLRVARTGVLDKLRRAQRWSLIMDSGEPSATQADPAPGSERAIVASDRLREVLACIDTMSPRRREIFLLHRIEEMTYVQIARRLGISPKTVEANIARAMEQLSRDLGKHERNDE